MTQTTLHIDLETYSDVDLKKSNVYRYAASPNFMILFAWYAVDDGPLQLADTPEAIDAIPGLWDPAVLKVAHNAQFERVALSEFRRGQLELEPGEYLDPAEWCDTMALAAEHGYPRSLGALAKALGAEDKDTAGTLLINWFCKPDRSGKRRLPQDHAEKWAQFLEYGRQDVATLRDIYHRLPGWPTAAERDLYVVDQHINDRGILVDTDMAAHAVAAADDNRMLDELEIMSLAGIANPGSNVQMLTWLRDQGVQVSNLQAATVTELLTLPDHDPQAFLLGESNVSPAQGLTTKARRVLELRQELALVAAKKYTAALDRVNTDDRLRGSFQFFGAHTGRWAGRGVQLQNLPSATIKPGCSGCDEDSPEHGQHIDAAITAEVLDLKLGLGGSSHTLKALVRAMFMGPLTVVDYAAIEARVVAWLAGEQWALDAFAAGRDIYVETAERMGGLTRKEGKVAVLALGYNGGVNSLRVMGADGSDAKLQRLVTQWRDANPAIAGLWGEMQQAFAEGGPVGPHMSVEKDGADRLLRLPSGRAVVYHDLKARWKDTPFGRRRVISFADPGKPGGRTDTYGGKLTENVTQAVARDIIGEALVRLHRAGYAPVLHVHDEIGVEGDHSVEEIKRIMVEPPTWSTGLPLSAEGYKCQRYRKG